VASGPFDPLLGREQPGALAEQRDALRIELHGGEEVVHAVAANGLVNFRHVGARFVERARERAEAERLEIAFQQADAEALPFEDGSFDVVVSTFGVMFTPDQDRAASEMVRVCRRGGKIGLANWTPEGFIGQVFKTIGKHVAPPAGAKSPALWGTRARIAELFGPHAASVKSAQRDYTFRYRSPEHWLDVFKTYYGPLLKTFAALEPAAQSALERDLIVLIAQFNRAADRSMLVPSEYLEIVITRH
jgi:ubiquinone/menaquinone biosynthesis C-methylase UbiE